MSVKKTFKRKKDDSTLVCTIDSETWNKLLRQPTDLRGEVLRLAETGGKEAVEKFLATLE
jgi:hypothetical protein